MLKATQYYESHEVRIYKMNVECNNNFVERNAITYMHAKLLHYAFINVCVHIRKD